MLGPEAATLIPKWRDSPQTSIEVTSLDNVPDGDQVTRRSLYVRLLRRDHRNKLTYMAMLLERMA
jgi:hypothetical protein